MSVIKINVTIVDDEHVWYFDVEVLIIWYDIWKFVDIMTNVRVTCDTLLVFELICVEHGYNLQLFD